MLTDNEEKQITNKKLGSWITIRCDNRLCIWPFYINILRAISIANKYLINSQLNRHSWPLDEKHNIIIDNFRKKKKVQNLLDVTANEPHEFGVKEFSANFHRVRHFLKWHGFSIIKLYN